MLGRRWFIDLRLVCTGLSEAGSDVASPSRHGLNVGEWCSVSAAAAPQLNHQEEVVTVPSGLRVDFNGTSPRHAVFSFDLGLQSYGEETFHALFGSKCQQRN